MVSLQHCFHSEQPFFLLEQRIFNVPKTFQTDRVKSSTQSRLVIQNYCFIEYPIFFQKQSNNLKNLLEVNMEQEIDNQLNKGQREYIS